MIYRTGKIEDDSFPQLASRGDLPQDFLEFEAEIPAGGAELRLDLIDGLNGGKLFIFGSSSILKCFLAGSKQKITQGVSMKDAKIQINLCIYA